MSQLALMKEAISPNDVVYTPSNVTEDIIANLKPIGKILDPCLGDGAFF